MSFGDGSADRADRHEPLEVTERPDCPGSWWSGEPPGAKVCTLRLEGIHLVHTGLAEGWDADQLREYFHEASSEFAPVASPAAEPGPEAEATGPGPVALSLPPEVLGWVEALRYGHEEMWPEAESPGTTAVLDVAGSLWVVARGAHEVSILCEAGERKPEPIASAPGGCSLWRLDRSARWRVEVNLAGGLSALWTARWRPEPVLVPAAEIAAPPGAEATEGVVSTGPGLAEPAAAATVPALIRGRAGAAATLDAIVSRWRRLSASLGPRRPALTRAGLALATLAALALLWAAVPRGALSSGWMWLGDVCTGRYRAHVESVPPGAMIVLDGHETGVRTPAWILVREGGHRLELSLGEYGSVTLAIDGRRGARITQTAALLGTLAIGSADSSVTLYARIDSEPAGKLPALLDSVPAGRRLISFQGRDVRPWTEEVSVVAGRTTQILARPEKVPDIGVVTARAYRVGQEGLKDLPGAAIYLDGKMAGVTPVRLQVTRGLHTARLVAGGVRSPVQLLRVEGGQEIFATAEFGRSPEPEVVEELLGIVSAARPPVVRARLASQLPLRVDQVRLHVRKWGREFDRVPMELGAGTHGQVAEIELPVRGAPAGARVSYFVTIISDDGEEFVSEMRTVTLVP